MNRREAITVGAAGAALLATGNAARAEAPRGKAPASGGGTDALLAALRDCQLTGEVCIAHCTAELANGNKEFGRCNAKAHEMVAMTRAMLTMVAHGSPLAKQLAAVCAAACVACRDACAEHKAHFAHGMHLPCKACLEACEKCDAQCRQFAA